MCQLSSGTEDEPPNFRASYFQTKPHDQSRRGWKFTLKFALRAEIGPEDGNLKSPICSIYGILIVGKYSIHGASWSIGVITPNDMFLRRFLINNDPSMSRNALPHCIDLPCQIFVNVLPFRILRNKRVSKHISWLKLATCLRFYAFMFP